MVDLFSGWRKVRELAPRVRFALFHSESLPSFRRRGCSASGSEPVGREADDCWFSVFNGSDMVTAQKLMA